MSYPYQLMTQADYENAYKKSVENPEEFWAGVAENFVWRKKWDKVLEWNFTEPSVKWFIGGKLNITENCLDQWAQKQPDTPAIIWEPNNPNDSTITLTYKELLGKVIEFAVVLKNNGVRKGDRVCIYMPMVTELAIAMLACARIGAIHNIVFGGFSAKSIRDRIEDSQCTFVITADGVYRGAKPIDLKSAVDAALEGDTPVKKVIVLNHANIAISMKEGRDLWWHNEIAALQGKELEDPIEEMDAEDMLYILYTSGSTGKPKGVVHTTGGYMVYVTYSFVNVFQYKPGDIYFCTADIGWVTGHSYIVYGPLAAGATSLMFEGIPTYPDAGRFWDIVDKHKVNILYTAPTAIRSLMAFGLDPLKGKDLGSLKVIGSVGEPINLEAWQWYYDNVGKKNCPLVDTWWQTENGGILISTLAGITPSIPTFATRPLPGIQPVLVDANGKELEGNNVAGNLCIKFPWPSMLRTTYGDHERCRVNYFATYPGYYFSGDGALRDENGNYRITGRVDDVINVSGHRIGTAEVESAINVQDSVVESAVVGYPHDIKGQALYAFVILDGNISEADALAKINTAVNKEIGHFARPDKIQFVKGLPKTRSGKIMRRILRKIAEGEMNNLGDTTTLLNPEVVEEIKNHRLN
ncbi:MAG: acetate--CoA ligase [Chitinophagaceae bacterium]|nr:acetate--CoA ligase [Chitinophagaceae bacterium]MCW5914877.1 acetate--CoA ligase [Chitinophagaceae bacterium]